MKPLHYLATIFLVASVFVSCTKDYSAELPGSSPDASKGYSYGSAVFSLNGSPYACTSDSILGTYIVGKLLDSSNRIVISVLVDTVGTYTIYTGNSYGISFSGTGLFKTLGVQNISLYGYGTPTNSGTFNYTPGLHGCSFALTITGTAITSDCKSCIYIPTCQGSSYTYMDSVESSTQWHPRNVNFLTAKDTLLDGIGFTSVHSQAGYSYYSCSNGTTIQVVYNEVPTITGDNALVAFKHIVLEANAALGAAWISNVANSYGQNYSYVYRMAEKGISRQVLDSTYSEVIHVHTAINITSGGNTYSVGSEDFYYARNIGLIEKDSSDYSNVIRARTCLKSYAVPQ
jgi:hypothetical protein